MRMLWLSLIIGVFAVTVPTVAAQATTQWTFTQDTRAAAAAFEVEGTTLKVTLTNTSARAVQSPDDVLTGVYVDLPGVALAPRRVVLGDGSTVLFASSGTGVDANGELGGEYGYRSDIPGVFTEAAHVLSAVGLGDLVGPPDLFPGDDLVGPRSPNGIGYGLVSFIDATSNSKVSGAVPLVRNAVVFHLDLPAGHTAPAIRNVAFNYGSDFNPYPGTNIPAPPTVVTTFMGLAGILAYVRRRTA